MVIDRTNIFVEGQKKKRHLTKECTEKTTFEWRNACSNGQIKQIWISDSNFINNLRETYNSYWKHE
jgi:hypothetical protein